MADEAPPQNQDAETPPLTREALDALEVTLKIDGSDQVRKIGDILNEAQKKGAADNSLREARETLESAKEEAEALLGDNKHAIEVYQNLVAAKAGDPDAIRRSIIGLGYKPEDVDALIAQYNEGAEPTGKAPVAAPPQLADATAADVTAFFKAAREQGVDPKVLANVLATGLKNQGKENVKTALTSGLTSLDTTRKLMGKGGDSAKALVEVAEAVLTRRLVETGRDPSPEFVKQAIETTGSLLGQLGTTTSPSPLEGDVLGIGESISGVADGTPDHLPDKPLKQPPITDTEAHNVWLTHRMREIARGEPGTP